MCLFQLFPISMDKICMPILFVFMYVLPRGCRGCSVCVLLFLLIANYYHTGQQRQVCFSSLSFFNGDRYSKERCSISNQGKSFPSFSWPNFVKDQSKPSNWSRLPRLCVKCRYQRHSFCRNMWEGEDLKYKDLILRSKGSAKGIKEESSSKEFCNGKRRYRQFLLM